MKPSDRQDVLFRFAVHGIKHVGTKVGSRTSMDGRVVLVQTQFHPEPMGIPERLVGDEG